MHARLSIYGWNCSNRRHNWCTERRGVWKKDRQLPQVNGMNLISKMTRVKGEGVIIFLVWQVFWLCQGTNARLVVMVVVSEVKLFVHKVHLVKSAKQKNVRALKCTKSHEGKADATRNHRFCAFLHRYKKETRFLQWLKRAYVHRVINAIITV